MHQTLHLCLPIQIVIVNGFPVNVACSLPYATYLSQLHFTGNGGPGERGTGEAMAPKTSHEKEAKSPGTFPGLKTIKIAFVAGAVPQTLLGELTELSQLFSHIQGGPKKTGPFLKVYNLSLIHI